MKAVAQAPFDHPSLLDRKRHVGKRARTRIRIMDTAAYLMATQAFDTTSASNIAKAADVAHGTFYLHFKDKEDLAQAVALEVSTRFTVRIDEMLSPITDMAERNGKLIRHFIELCAQFRPWGWSICQALVRVPVTENPIYGEVWGDVQRGVESGAFDVVADEVLISTLIVTAANGVKARLHEDSGPEVGSRIAELILRMLGADHERARQIAWEPLEKTDYSIIVG